MFEFRNPNLERAVSLTAADRKWMDSIVKDVNEGWDDGDPNKPASIRYIFLRLASMIVNGF